MIAIDGPAASGKSTVARLVARRLGFVYMDTGAMYRAFAWLALVRGVEPTSRAAVRELIRSVQSETRVVEGQVRLWLDGEDPTAHLRSPEVNRTVSPIAAIPELREHLVIRQRRVRTDHPLVVEGRDIGTVVFPDTLYKFFLDADPAVRQQRRAGQGQVDVLQDRDQRDQSRGLAPLIRAADAMALDSGAMDAEGLAERIVRVSQERGLRAGAAPDSPVALS
ncbi:MAG: (d)CMP kinase [Verrucomicrobiia bacterium]